MSAIDLVDAVIEDRKSFKKAGRELESLPPDPEAVDRLITAYRDGKTPGWLAVYLLGCVGHTNGYETAMSILLSNEGKSYAGVALAKIDRLRAFPDLRQVILRGQHQKVRSDAAYGLAAYRSEEAIDVFLKAHDGGRLLPLNQVAYHVAECRPTDATVSRLLRSPNARKQKLAFAVIEWLVADNSQLPQPGREIAALVQDLLHEPGIVMSAQRRERLSAWSSAALAIRRSGPRPWAGGR